MKIDDSRVDAWAILAAIGGHRGPIADLDAVLAAAQERVPDDLTPYYRAAEALLTEDRELGRAQLYLRRYLAHEPEGNAPALSEAGKALSAMRASPALR